MDQVSNIEQIARCPAYFSAIFNRYSPFAVKKDTQHPPDRFPSIFDFQYFHSLRGNHRLKNIPYFTDEFVFFPELLSQSMPLPRPIDYKKKVGQTTHFF